MYRVFEALDELGAIVEEARGVPMTAGCVVPRGDVLELIENKSPDYLFCAFDHPGETFRHEIFDQYKIHREEMPADELLVAR